MTNPVESASEFFNEIGDRYDAVIERCVPRYHEMLNQMLDYLPDFQPARILELGCGSGNLTDKVISKYPTAQVTVIDGSEKMLSIVEQRFADHETLTTQQSLFQELNFAPNSFDLILSSISIHHLNDDEKLDLFSKTRGWLSERAIFTFCDQFAGQSNELYAKHISFWKAASFAMGATSEEWKDWMDHQQVHDYHSSLQTHFDLLGRAGFGLVDCIRRHFLWTTMYCTR